MELLHWSKDPSMVDLDTPGWGAGRGASREKLAPAGGSKCRQRGRGVAGARWR